MFFCTLEALNGVIFNDMGWNLNLGVLVTDCKKFILQVHKKKLGIQKGTEI